MTFNFRIQTKLFLLMVGLTALILSGVLFVINHTVQKTVQEKVIADFKRVQIFFQRQQTLIYDRLIESSLLIQQNSAFKANIELNNPATYYVEGAQQKPSATPKKGLQDPASVYFSVEEFAQYLIVDMFIVTNKEGKVLARYGEPDKFGDDLSFRPSVTRALKGGSSQEDVAKDGLIWPRLWENDGKLYQVATEAIWLTDVIGTITLGLEISDQTTKELVRADSNISIVFFHDRKPVASNLENVSPIDLNNFVDTCQDKIEVMLAERKPTEPFITDFRGQKVFAFLSPAGVGEPAYYLAIIPLSTELQILDTLRRNIALTAAVSLLITVLLAIFLGNTFSQPVLRLAEGMVKVKEGNLDISVQATTRDEIGQLTVSFNEMIVGLRERLNLMKYVGSHTQEMIKQSSGSEVQLGGERKDVCVLFSDIRGFTAYSEKRTPEQVINMLNHYLGFQAEIVNQYNGSIDKFVGDEMMALFVGGDAIERALQCSVDIQLRVLKEHETDPVPIYIGIGVNYGPVVMGNMGAQHRMDYTVLGAAVNLGARLCSGAKAGQILIRRELLKGLETKFKIGSSETMKFKGFSEAKEIVDVESVS